MNKQLSLKDVCRIENECIGDLKDRFVCSTLKAQHSCAISPGQVVGAITQAFYRGIIEGKNRAT